jgi:hypothetical protein
VAAGWASREGVDVPAGTSMQHLQFGCEVTVVVQPETDCTYDHISGWAARWRVDPM